MAFPPGISGAEADVLERMIAQGQQGAALPPALCPLFQSQQEAMEGVPVHSSETPSFAYAAIGIRPI